MSLSQKSSEHSQTACTSNGERLITQSDDGYVEGFARYDFLARGPSGGFAEVALIGVVSSSDAQPKRPR